MAAEVSDEKNRNTGLVLGALEIKMLLETVETSVNHSVSVEEVEEVHEPQNRLDYDC